MSKPIIKCEDEQTVDINDIVREENSMLIRRFVASVGYDYRQNYPRAYPVFSDDTVAYWNEIEKRMKAPRCLRFQREDCLSELKAESKKQSDIVASGEHYVTSYHYGIQSGLNKAIRIIEKYVVTIEE